MLRRSLALILGRRRSSDDASMGNYRRARVHQLIIHGDVQGVGFRDFVVDEARRMCLTGWVRNRSDGTVEVLVSDSPNTESFIRACHAGPNGASVERIDVLQLDRDGNDLGEKFTKRRTYFVVDDAARAEMYRQLGIEQSAVASFIAFHRSGLLERYSEESVSAAKEYWRSKLSVDIDPALHIAYENITDLPDPRVVPSNEYRRIREFFNGDNYAIRTYSDKNLYSHLVRTDRQPQTYVKRVRGHYCDGKNNLLDRADVGRTLASLADQAIIKPSRTNNGDRIESVHVGERGELMVGGETKSLEWLERRYGLNFLIQEVIEQDRNMALPHPSSVNTLRVVTLRLHKEIHHLLTFARFGVGGRINDNAGTGGVCVGVRADGSFLPYGINEHTQVLSKHPTTHVEFGSLPPIPSYKDFIDFSMGLHADLLHYDLVSWDIAVAADSKPLFIEHNFRGATWLYQLAVRRPLFGELTDEVLDYVVQNGG